MIGNNVTTHSKIIGPNRPSFSGLGTVLKNKKKRNMEGMEKFCDLKKIYMEFIIKIVN